MPSAANPEKKEGKLIVGLEIHFQLKGQKLFCGCPTEGIGIKVSEFERKLSPTASEMGLYDPAVEYEKARSRTFRYHQMDNSCLVEADEEPPHEPNRDAIETGFMVAHALNCNLMDSVMFMRKIVVDGSNTSGFQRTAVIGLNGSIETSRGKVRISTVCIEEDSARKAEEKNSRADVVSYSLDRLGIPLLEIATEPDIVDPDHAVEVASKIGYIVSSTGKSRREVDSIRQDVNISLGFGRVEMKGIQKLSLIGDSIRHEAERQRSVNRAVHELLSRGGSGKDFNFTDVKRHFSTTESKMLKGAFKRGDSIFCSIGPNLSGLLKNGDFRLGKDLSDIAKAYGLGGILHSDELPAFGLTENELSSVSRAVKPGPRDALIFIVTSNEKHERISMAFNQRIRKLISLDLSETRGPNEDGTTRFLRPLPGSERMYPETDVPLFVMTDKMLKQVEAFIPRSREEIAADLTKKYGISAQDAETIAANHENDLLAKYAQASGNGKIAARVLLQTVPELEKKHGKKTSSEEVKKLLEMGRKKDWSRALIESALEAMISSSISAIEASKVPEKKLMNRQELRIMIQSILDDSEDDIKLGVLIARIKQRSDKSFDPKDALALLQELK